MPKGSRIFCDDLTWILISMCFPQSQHIHYKMTSCQIWLCWKSDQSLSSKLVFISFLFYFVSYFIHIFIQYFEYFESWFLFHFYSLNEVLSLIINFWHVFFFSLFLISVAFYWNYSHIESMAVKQTAIEPWNKHISWMLYLTNSQTLKMISLVKSFLYPDKQSKPVEGWRRIQPRKCCATNNNKDEDKSPKSNTQNIGNKQ